MAERIIAEPEAEDERIDRYLASYFENKSRTGIRKLIEEERILVNGRPCKPSTILRSGDSIDADFPDPEILSVEAEDIPLDVVYEDEDLLVVNKPRGMVVHPAAGHLTGTLVNALLYHCHDLSGINGVLRPGIVHRIDRDTSGLLIVCKNDYAHQKIAEQLAVHSIERKYLAIVRGDLPNDEGVIDSPIGRSLSDRKKMTIRYDGKRAVTHYRVLKRNGSETLIECVLETGRTHQIRVHMASIGHPLYGDPVYGIARDRNSSGQLLHAALIGFIHPRKNEKMVFEKEPPESFSLIQKKLKLDL